MLLTSLVPACRSGAVSPATLSTREKEPVSNQTESPLAVLYRPELREYDFGAGHPFQGERFAAFIEVMGRNLNEEDYRIIEAEAATEEDLLLVCEKEYIDFTRDYFSAPAIGPGLPDEFIRFHSWDNVPAREPGRVEEAARLIVGQAKLACDLVQNKQYEKVVSVGGGLHHAKSAYGEGFCLYNDVAYCGRYLLEHYNLERILILDTDAHAGNGTAEYFYDDPRVLFIDLHQEALYPFTGFISETGSGEGKGFKINIPLPAGAGDDSYRLVFESIVVPLAREFSPQVIIWNGGSDPYFADALTDLGLTLKGLGMLGEKVENLAGICEGRVIYLIGSGYNDDILPYAWLALVSGLRGIAVDIEECSPVIELPSTLARTRSVVEEVRFELRDYWDCFE